MTIKALSLWEPWASLMRCGAKTIETRSWRTDYRGPLLICGAKRWTKDQENLLHTTEVQRALGAIPEQEIWITRIAMCLGRAACIVDLVDCVSAERAADQLQDDDNRDELLFGDYSFGRWAWMTANLRNGFEPFRVFGARGLFDAELPEGITL